MTKPFEQWTVLLHGKLVSIDDNILAVVGDIAAQMPLEPEEAEREAKSVLKVAAAGTLVPPPEDPRAAKAVPEGKRVDIRSTSPASASS